MSGRRVLHVATFAFPDQAGGAERVVTELAAAQARAGERVTLVVGRLGAVGSDLGDGVRRAEFALDGRARGIAFLRAARRGCRAALASLADERFDVVHVHQPATAAIGLAHPAAARVATFHAAWSRERAFGRETPRGPGAWLERARDAAARRLDRTAVRGADRVIVHSNSAAAELRAVAPELASRCRVVAPGVDLARFAPLTAHARAAARMSLGVREDESILLTMRRLVPRTGVDRLLSAFAITAAARANVRLVVAGDGSERGALERAAASLATGARITFLGRIPDPRVPSLLGASDLCVLPSLALEGFGIVTLEALACGTPVLATSVGANPEVIARLTPDRTTVAPTAEGIAAGIAGFLADPAPWRAAATAAAAAIHAPSRDWSWDACARSVGAVYDEALASAPRRR